MLSSNLSIFDQQFEPDGSAYLFRHNRNGPAYRVTARDREVAMQTYQRRLWIVIVPLVVMVLAVAAVAVILVRWYGPIGATSLAFLLVAMVLFYPLHQWAWNGASLPLRRGFAVSPALDPDDARRDAAESLDGWTVLLIGGGIAIGPLLKMDHFPPQGWDWVNVAIAAIGPLIAGGLMIWKYRHSRR